MSSPPSSGAQPLHAIEAEPAKRASASCKRCRVRKIKCDSGLESCAPCKKAGVKCIDVSRNNQDVPRSISVELVERIVWLESILTERCPDVDLQSGPAASVASSYAQSIDLQPGGKRDVHRATSVAFASTIDQSSSLDNLFFPSSTSKRPRLDSHTVTEMSGPMTVTSPSDAEDISHEVGLVSLVGSTDAKYVGPSSGFTFAKLIRAALQTSLHRPIPDDAFAPSGSATPVAGLRDAPSMLALRAALSRNRLEDTSTNAVLTQHPLEAAALVELFFNDVHFQFPCLHRPSFQAEMTRMYDNKLLEKDNHHLSMRDHLTVFQCLMVQAVAMRVCFEKVNFGFTAGGLFNRAMIHLEHVMGDTSTLEKTQCLLLVAVYSLYSPAAPNTWTLSYHLMANCVDLGLQRKLSASESLSATDIDLRKRVFWSVYTMDRILSCTLGRPLSLRDEGFDVPMPANADDEDLEHTGFTPVGVDHLRLTTMTPSIRLFEIMQIYSDIKLHIYRVRREPDRFPWPTDLEAFRQRTMQALGNWRASAASSSPRGNIRHYLDLKYHGAVLLLFRPSPAFPTCSVQALGYCANSAKGTLQCLDAQQRLGRLPCSHLYVHDTFLSGLTLLFCLIIYPADSLPQNRFMPEIRSCSSVLAALGDVWTEARKARNVFDKLADLVIPLAAQARTVTFNNPSTAENQQTFFTMPQQVSTNDNNTMFAPLGLEQALQQMVGDPASADDLDWLLNPTISSGLDTTWDAGLDMQFFNPVDGGMTDLSTNTAIQDLLSSMFQTA